MELAWHAVDVAALAAQLERLGFEVARAGAGLAASAGSASIRLVPSSAVEDGRLELLGAAPARPPGEPGPADARLALVALGWATVDLERAAGEFPMLEFVDAGDDVALGARARIGRSAGAPADETALVLLEPSTEGRLAARLARHGEGPAVLYMAVRDGGPVRGAQSGTGVPVDTFAAGPFGPSVRVTTPSFAVQVILVGMGSAI